MRRIATWSMPSLRAALARIGSMMADPLHAARRALRAARRRVGQHRHAAPAHGLRLVQQRDDAARRGGIALLVVGTVVADDEHIQGR